MTRQQLINSIKEKKSYLCVGLDTSIEKIPGYLKASPDAIFQFNKHIIDATKDLCVAYKINTAFYEANGAKGWQAMEQTVNYIPSTHFKIADAKRGDIGNTSSQYAKAFFEVLNFDAITVAPYMGADSIQPFLEHENKWTIVLGLTSNKGSEDFEQLKTGENYLYETVIKKVSGWGSRENLMFVVGATKASELSSIRKIIPYNFLLIPGVGTQGGSLEEVSKCGLNNDCGLLVNASRAIIYAGKGENFAEEARKIAHHYQKKMEIYLSEIG
ncbi:MAG: orotidine-5'-phosphate decarboxylase [Bacteroidota bacterium]|nr:orotidine-5'-phosphate decarboxylase [Bacteroidota bacterium]MDQ6889057.1 orotidine-5'-phosphate decarboxylase [Bacteroidota bacterium]